MLRISSGAPFERTIGFSRAVRVGDRVLVSGTAPTFGLPPPWSSWRPAATMVVVAACRHHGRRGGLLDPRWVVEIEAEALVAP